MSTTKLCGHSSLTSSKIQEQAAQSSEAMACATVTCLEGTTHCYQLQIVVHILRTSRGYDDYLWVWSTGEILLFENSQDLPHWIVHDQILATGRERKSIQLGDWDGDGLCDVLSVDRATGAVDMWKNTWKAGQKAPTFAAAQRVIDTGNHCTEGWGPGLYDLGLRFADM
jgi:hypothetical protein